MRTALTPPVIRDARPEDTAPLLEIYRPFVTASAVSFELVPPSLEDFGDRIARARAHWGWLVAEADGVPVGAAYGGPHRLRGAYLWSVEVSIFLAPGAQRRGIGTRLYQRLLELLALRGYCNAYAGIPLPNPGSEALHARLGFAPVGTFPAVGRKFGRWHDVAWWHLRLRDDPPSEPVE